MKKNGQISEIVDADVFDETTDDFLLRVAAAPSSGEYVLADDGAFIFSPADAGHLMTITPYSGALVTIVRDRRQARRRGRRSGG